MKLQHRQKKKKLFIFLHEVNSSRMKWTLTSEKMPHSAEDITLKERKSTGWNGSENFDSMQPSGKDRKTDADRQGKNLL